MLPIDILRLYGYRSKIELSFKQALHVVTNHALTLPAAWR